MSPWAYAKFKRVITSIIWSKCPKNVFVERQTLLECKSAVIVFNEGCQGIRKVIEYMGLDTGSRLITNSRQRDSVRVRKMVKKCNKKGKKEEENSGRSQKRTGRRRKS